MKAIANKQPSEASFQKKHIAAEHTPASPSHYSMVFDPRTIKKMAKIIDAGVFLSVGTKHRKTFHRQFEPLKITERARTLVEIVLIRDDLTRGKKTAVEPYEKPEVKETEGARLEDINSILGGRHVRAF